MWNADLEVSLCSPTTRPSRSTATARATSCCFVCEGSGTLETVYGSLAFREHDYVVIPRGTTYRFRLDDGPQRWLVLHTPGELETPNRYRNRYGQLLESAPYSQRDFHPPAELETHREGGEHELIVRVRGGLQRYELDYHPLDVVGWDGYVYPYTFNVHDFEPRHRAPAPAAARAPDLPGSELRDLLVLPARARLRPAGGADPVPPLEPAVRGGHLLRLRRVRQPQGDRDGLDHRASVRPPARAAAGSGREVARDAPHRGARGDVGHVQAAAAHRARRRDRRSGVRATRGATASRRRWRSPRRDREVGCSRRHSSTRR